MDEAEGWTYFGLFFSVLFTMAFILGYFVGIKIGLTPDIIPSLILMLLLPPSIFGCLGCLIEFVKTLKGGKNEEEEINN